MHSHPAVSARLPRLLVIAILAITTLPLCLPTRALTQDLDDLTKDEKPGELDILDDLNADKKQSDLAGMKLSHLSLIDTWQPVRPQYPAQDDKQTYHWAISNGAVSPLGDQPISTLIQVPQKGKYRVYLRNVLTMV